MFHLEREGFGQGKLLRKLGFFLSGNLEKTGLISLFARKRCTQINFYFIGIIHQTKSARLNNFPF
jgi:hypothetical protein